MDSHLARALGQDFNEKVSLLIYLVVIPASLIHSYVSLGLYLLVALIWLVPDRRIEWTLDHEP